MFFSAVASRTSNTRYRCSERKSSSLLKIFFLVSLLEKICGICADLYGSCWRNGENIVTLSHTTPPNFTIYQLTYETGNPSCRFHEPPPQSVYLIHIGSIQSLLYLSRTSDLPDWEHAIHCAESLSRIFHSAININDQSFEQTLMESGVSRPEGAPPPIEVPLMSLCESCVRSVHGLNKGVQTLGLHIESHDNIAQLRPHDSWTTLKQHNWNMAQKLSQTQQELNEAKRALGI